ncbi:MAG TPA: hypothetical protein VGO21_01530 [Candidatus Paceibacterota bacterium]|jgi:hypothetical protein|nr:hypothetical protein [Candidatus Paceibacterota bacterium]
MDRDLLSELIAESNDPELSALALALENLNRTPEEMQEKLVEGGYFVPTYWRTRSLS